VKPDHAKDRLLSKSAGAPQAWRRLSPLEACFERGQLSGGRDGYTPAMRLDAGTFYARLFARAQASGRDSTDLVRIDGAGRRMEFSEAQARAAHSLASIHARLSRADALIVRMVCGEGYFPSEAVRTACNDYRHSVPARLREALDALIDALKADRSAHPREE
jgi:hypothetical protein